MKGHNILSALNGCLIVTLPGKQNLLFLESKVKGNLALTARLLFFQWHIIFKISAVCFCH